MIATGRDFQKTPTVRKLWKCLTAQLSTGILLPLIFPEILTKPEFTGPWFYDVV
jgi:hypothetical protein